MILYLVHIKIFLQIYFAACIFIYRALLIQSNKKQKNLLWGLCSDSTHAQPFTCLRRVDGDHGAEGTLSFAVVSANLNVKRREGRDAVVAVHVARRARGGGGHVSPASFSEGAESDDVTKALTIL